MSPKWILRMWVGVGGWPLSLGQGSLELVEVTICYVGGELNGAGDLGAGWWCLLLLHHGH